MRAHASRAIYMANILGVDMGMFYKRRDYAHIDRRPQSDRGP